MTRCEVATGLVAWGIVCAVSAGGCGGHGATEVAWPASTERGSARAAAADVPLTRARAQARGSDREALLADALRGVVAGDETHLSARMQLKPLRMPHPARGASARFDFDGGKRGWVTALPQAELLASPAFARGKVYIGGGFSSHELFALDAYSGEMAWAVAAPDGGPSAAIVHDGKVLFNTESCTLFVVDAETGELKWKRYLGDPLMSQPAADGQLVFSAYPAGGGHKMGAFRLGDGAPVWTHDIPADVIQAPQVQGDSVWFATMDGSVFRLDKRTGRARWSAAVGAASPLWVDREHVLLTRRVDVPATSGGAAVTYEQPVVLAASDGRIEREGERVAAPYLSGQSRDRELARGQPGAWGQVPHGDHLGLVNVAAGWAFQGSSAAVVDGRAYFAVGGEIRAREVATGRDVWHRSYAEARDAQAVSPPAVVDGSVIFGTVDGHLYAVDIDTGMTQWAYDVGEPVVFQPIVAQGWVYVATGRGNLVGLEIGDAQLDGWHMWGGNAQHAGLVETAGALDPGLLDSRARPTRGTMRVARVEQAPAPEANEPEAAPEPEPGAARSTTVRAERRQEPELPLERTRVEGQVSGIVARMHVTQVFRNALTQPIEAVYLFPLPDDAAVDAMEMHIGERIVRARIQGRQQARTTYEHARAEGHHAALLEQQRPALFAQRVANIGPGERIEVRISYVQILPFDNGEYELAFPVVAPRRFDPRDPLRTRARRDPLAPRAGAAPAISAVSARADTQPPVELAVELDAGMPIERIASPTHRISTERRSAERVKVTLDDPATAAQRDFVLRYSISGETPRATVLAHRERDEGWLTLLVQPPAAPADATVAPRDVVVVVDSSSSMRGRPIEQARAITAELLGSLRATDRFQVLSFADEVTATASTLELATPEAVTRGRAFTAEIRAVGATYMVPAIERALDRSEPADPGRVRMTVLVTDGYIGNEADVMRSIATRLGDSRVYAIGVGSSTNRFLLERAAEIGRGRARFVTLSEDPVAAGRQFAALVDKPVLTDVTVDWGGLAVEDVYPRQIPDLFASKPLVLEGRFVRGGRAQVRVQGTVAGQRVERVVDVVLPDAPSATEQNASQRVLWARAAIRDRLARMSLREDPALIQEVTALGLRHAIVTPYTSFVAVDVTPATGAAAEPGEATAASTATLSPARSLPGDPEIRVPAPADARAVTFVLPFGETVSARFERAIGMWTGRFLVPRDAGEGQYPVYVLITYADGHDERLVLWYTVDESAPLVDFQVIGDARPGAEIVLRARQTLTRADLAVAGMRPHDPRLTPERAEILSDARRVEIATPACDDGVARGTRGCGQVITLDAAGPGVWEARWRVPDDATRPIDLAVVVVDMAANVRTQRARLEVLQ